MKQITRNDMFGNTDVPKDTTMTGLTKGEIVSRIGSGMSASVADNSYESLNPFVVVRKKFNPCRIAQQDFSYVEVEEFEPMGIEKIKGDIVDIIEISELDKTEFLATLDSNKKKIRDFLLKEIAPLDMAVGMAVSEVSQELNLITGSPVHQNFRRVNEMLTEIINIKVVEFLSKHIELDSMYLQMIVESFINKHNPVNSDVFNKLLDLRQNQKG